MVEELQNQDEVGSKKYITFCPERYNELKRTIYANNTTDYIQICCKAAKRDVKECQYSSDMCMEKGSENDRGSYALLGTFCQNFYVSGEYGLGGVICSCHLSTVMAKNRQRLICRRHVLIGYVPERRNGRKLKAKKIEESKTAGVLIRQFYVCGARKWHACYCTGDVERIKDV